MIYHRGVRLRVSCARAFAIAAAIGCLLPARAAHAGTVPAGSVVRVDAAQRTIDLAAFARTIATRYNVVLRRVVTADIDRDGDLDIVAATDRGFLVWVNDGRGRLTSQTPNPKSGLDGGAPADTWSGDSTRHAETIQNDAPSTRLTSADAHAPPPAPTADLPSVTLHLSSDLRTSAHIPRAPPPAVR